MRTPSGRAEAYWAATAPATDFPRLAGDIDVDVAIVGGGIVGITAARLLSLIEKFGEDSARAYAEANQARSAASQISAGGMRSIAISSLRLVGLDGTIARFPLHHGQ